MDMNSKRELSQENWVRVYSVNEDLRRRNGELSIKLLELNEDSFQSMTSVDRVSRANRIYDLVIAAIDWADGKMSGDELRETAEKVSGYVEDWTAERRYRIESAKKTQKTKQDAKGE